MFQYIYIKIQFWESDFTWIFARPGSQNSTTLSASIHRGDFDFQKSTTRHKSIFKQWFIWRAQLGVKMPNKTRDE